MLILYTVFVLSGIIFAYIYKKYARILELSKNFPGPRALPIIGNGHYFLGKKSEEYLQIAIKISEQYGETFKIWFGPEFNMLVGDLKGVEKILNSTKLNEKASEYKVLRPWLNQGLLISSGRKWFQRRKIITPAFHFKILEQFIDVFDSQSNTLIKNLQKFKPDDEVDLYPFVTLCALDIICETAMGTTANAQLNSESKYVQAVQDISEILHKRMFNVMYRYDFIFNLMPIVWKQKKALAIIHKFSEDVIVSRRDEILKGQKENKPDENYNDIGAKKKMAFLDILLQSEIDGKPLTNLEIREEVDTFMFEGHDTTASAIHFCLYSLACYPEAQEKCFQEICEIIGKDKTKPVTYQELNSLHYLELCIKETLRLYPSVPLVGRLVHEEFDIDGKLVPVGTNIGVSAFQLGRMESLYPNASKFIPERFELEACEKMNPYAFVPFSAGPRNCIGQKFAILEMKSTVSKVLRNHQLEYIGPPEGPILVAALILRCKNTLKFRLKPRIY